MMLLTSCSEIGLPVTKSRHYSPPVKSEQSAKCDILVCQYIPALGILNLPFAGIRRIQLYTLKRSPETDYRAYEQRNTHRIFKDDIHWRGYISYPIGSNSCGR